MLEPIPRSCLVALRKADLDWTSLGGALGHEYKVLYPKPQGSSKKVHEYNFGFLSMQAIGEPVEGDSDLLIECHVSLLLRCLRNFALPILKFKVLKPTTTI